MCNRNPEAVLAVVRIIKVDRGWYINGDTHTTEEWATTYNLQFAEHLFMNGLALDSDVEDTLAQMRLADKGTVRLGLECGHLRVVLPKDPNATQPGNRIHCFECRALRTIKTRE